MEHEIRNRTIGMLIAANDQAIKSMLSRWVSELEPSIAYQNGLLIGLALAGVPIGSPMVLAIEVQESDYANS